MRIGVDARPPFRGQGRLLIDRKFISVAPTGRIRGLAEAWPKNRNMAKDIFLDGSFLAPRHLWCGVSRYVVSLLRQMSAMHTQQDGVRLRVLVPPDANLEDCGLERQTWPELISCSAMRHRRLWKRGLLALTARRLKADAVFLPVPGPVYFKTARLAVTVHDIIPFVFHSASVSWRERELRSHYRASIRRADLILTDSNYSRADISSRFNIPDTRITVAPLGFDRNVFNVAPVDQAEAADILNRYSIKKPYILHVGEFGLRKNLARLIRAYRSVLEHDPSLRLQLVMCGKSRPELLELLRVARDFNLQDNVIIVRDPSERELVMFYKSALACVMPSLYEGFGLPILEAMACGVPVMCSNRTSLPEVGGDAVAYFDPESEEDMSGVIWEVATHPEMRERLSQKGLQRAQRFSWEECAKITMTALQNL